VGTAALAALAQIVAVFKGISALKALVDQFTILWLKYDLDKIGDAAKAKKEEYEAINRAYQSSTSDLERRALLRALNRLR
jgi:preprotein translocase subunit Sec63